MKDNPMGNKGGEIEDPIVLMNKAKNGDKTAFGHLYELYLRPVYRYIYLRTKDKETAADLTQTVFLKIFQSLNRYRSQKKSPINYFFIVARNTVIDYWKKKKDSKIDNAENFFNNLADTENDIEDLIEKNDKLFLLKRAISSLTEVQQEVIILRFINDLSTREIAKLLGKTEDSVRQIQCRALKSLKIYFKKEGLLK